MPSTMACLFVAASLFAFAFLALVLGGYVHVPVSKWLLAAAGAGAALVFMGRGILGVLPAFEQAAAGTAIPVAEPAVLLAADSS